MADESPNRATVAGVDAKIDGLKELVRAEFADTRRTLDSLAGVPVKVAEIETTQADHERRISNIEQQKTRSISLAWMAAISFIAAALGAGLSHIPHFP